MPIEFGEIYMAEVSAVATKECPYCSEQINVKSKKCRHCGEIIDPQMRELELLKSQRSSQVFMNAGGGAAGGVAAVASEAGSSRLRGDRTKTAAILWCLFLGAVGAHKFYLGKPGWGLLYLIFCWTFIPAIIAVVELILLILTSEKDFDRKYNR